MPNPQPIPQQSLSLDHPPAPIEGDNPPADIEAGDAPPKDEEPANDPAVEDLCDGPASMLALDSRTSELRFLHPGKCRPSPLNGRDPARLGGASLEALVHSIAMAGVVTPILVRATDDATCPYEVIAGARRWAACAELVAKTPDLRLPAIIVAGDARTGVVTTDAENAARVGLSAYERGRAYTAALRNKAANSDAELAKLLGITNATVSNLTRLAAWPPELFAAYGGAHRILAVDAERLNPALAEHKDDLLEKAREIAPVGVAPPLARGEVTRLLLEAVSDVPGKLPDVVIRAQDNRVLIKVTRRFGNDISFRMTHRKADHDLLKKGFAKLLEQLGGKLRGEVKI